VARRSIEMYEYRQALMCIPQGDPEREIARSKLMGRSKAARFRELARAQGWLEPERPLPEDAEIADVLGQPKLPLTAQSSIAAYRPLVEQRLTQGVSGVVIHTTLKREHGFSGHYSSVRRLIAQIGGEQPPEATVRPTFAPGETAQVGLRGRPADGRSGDGRDPLHLGLRDDAVLLSAPARGVRLGPESENLARLPPSCLRVVRRRARGAHHRQRQVRDHPRVRARSAGAACLRRVRRGLRLPDRRLSAARPAEEGHRLGRRQIREGQLPVHTQLP